jgi:hypothetical protein
MTMTLRRSFGSTAQSPGCILGAAAILALVAIVNGYPLVFPDTGTYLGQAIELHGNLDRPPYYSMFLFPLHLKITLWLIPIAQDIFVALVLFLFLQLIFDNLGPGHCLVVVALLTGFSALPWVSNEIMPDVFVPLIVLFCFSLVWFRDRFGKVERWILALVLTGMISFHQANPLLVASLLGAMALVGLVRRRPIRWFARLVIVLGPLCIGIAAQSLYGYAVIGRITPSPSGPFFLLARVIYDGPGRKYLDAVCPSQPYSLCTYRDRLQNNNDWFLWSENSPLNDMLAKDGLLTARDEASAIVAGTLSRYPWEQLAMALYNGVRQFVRFDTTNTGCPCVRDRLLQIMTRHFPSELSSFSTSLQNTGRLPWPVISLVDSIVVVLSSLVLVIGVALGRRDYGFPCLDFLAFLLASLIANAFIMGALSGPVDRYQARLVWLVPATALGYIVSIVKRMGQGYRHHPKENAQESACFNVVGQSDISLRHGKPH